MDDQNKSVNDRWNPGAAGEPGTAAGRDYVGERGYATTAEPPAAGADQRTGEIRSEIEHTRAEMTETIDAIQDRLRPSSIVTRAKDSVREATVGRVRQLTHRHDDGVPRRAADWYYRTSIVDRVRENPIPVALAAASIAWLAFGKRPSRDYDGPPYEGPDEYAPRYGQREDYAGDEQRGRLSAPTSGLPAAYSEGRQQVADAVSETMSRAREMTSYAGDRLRSTGRQTRRRVQYLTHENTLAAGAVAAAVGVAIGLALPETEPENALMGEAREALVDRARQAARGATERVQQTAEELQRVATSALSATDTNRDRPATSLAVDDNP
jgi:ElaB/YqjD/DUF883 family membrane-anchored ribosome-binding protein